MEQVVVTFDQVLHVHRNRENRFHPKHSVFSFMSAGDYVPYVSVPGWPSIEPGTTVTAFLRQPGNWKSLVGWVNHASGEVAAPNFKRSAWAAVLDGVWSTAWFVLCPTQFGPLRWAPSIMGLLICVLSLVRARRERMEALEVKSSATALVALKKHQPSD